MHVIAAKAVCFKEAMEPSFAGLSAADRRQRRAPRGVAQQPRVPSRQRRHRQSPDAGGCLLEGPDRQGRRGGARQGGHHGQQERDSVRPEPADGGQRHPHRHARHHDARHARAGDGSDWRSHRARARVAGGRSRRLAWSRTKSNDCAGSFRCIPSCSRFRRTSRTCDPRRGRLRRRRSAGTRCVDGYEPRDGQRAMAAAVADVIEHGGTLIAEAGTGTGKTLAYLIPAILSGQRVLVSTGTKNLQEQIFFKDLPLAARRAGQAVQRDADEGAIELPLPSSLRDVPGRRRTATHRPRGRLIETRRPRHAADHQRVGKDDGDRRSRGAARPARGPAAVEGHRRGRRDLSRHRMPALRRLLRHADAPARRRIRRRHRQSPPALRRCAAAEERVRRGDSVVRDAGRRRGAPARGRRDAVLRRRRQQLSRRRSRARRRAQRRRTCTVRPRDDGFQADLARRPSARGRSSAGCRWRGWKRRNRRHATRPRRSSITSRTARCSPARSRGSRRRWRSGGPQTSPGTARTDEDGRRHDEVLATPRAARRASCART